ncbi:hypothetical protein QR685DRAFT_575252 [Neurospora intermedia]|uniref:Uncharacterized protein n=1 Tax=Neurospora intermedia TaxID=5142 RepID=A0ABR3D1S4_NEUIN
MLVYPYVGRDSRWFRIHSFRVLAKQQRRGLYHYRRHHFNAHWKHCALKIVAISTFTSPNRTDTCTSRNDNQDLSRGSFNFHLLFPLASLFFTPFLTAQ